MKLSVQLCCKRSWELYLVRVLGESIAGLFEISSRSRHVVWEFHMGMYRGVGYFAPT